MIGEKIRELRTKNGMTQSDLAEKLFVTTQAVSRWEKGDVEPSLTTVKSISEIFGVSIDEIMGKEKPEPVVVREKEYVYKESNPVLAVCEKCNKPIFDGKDIVRKRDGSDHTTIYCRACEEKIIEADKKNKIYNAGKRRKLSFIWGGIAAAVLLIAAIILRGNFLVPGIIASVCAFTFVSCWILDNNFIGDMAMEIMSWGFVKMPGLIFTLDLDGIVWLITVKLLFWVLGFALAVICAALAVTLGGIISLFVYPYAITKNVKRPLAE